MRTNLFIAILVIFTISKCCDISVKGSKIGVPKQFQIFYTQSKKHQLNLCFELIMPKSDQVYLLRLDYYPFQCLDAKNDAQLQWNQQKGLYFAQIQMKRKCKKRTLNEIQQEAYPIIYQFRQGYNKGGILAHNQLVHKYLPTLGVLLLVSIIAQRYIFQNVSEEKDKIK